MLSNSSIGLWLLPICTGKDLAESWLLNCLVLYSLPPSQHSHQMGRPLKSQILCSRLYTQIPLLSATCLAR